MIGLYVFGAAIIAPLFLLVAVGVKNAIQDARIIKRANEVSKQWRESH